MKCGGQIHVKRCPDQMQLLKRVCAIPQLQELSWRKDDHFYRWGYSYNEAHGWRGLDGTFKHQIRRIVLVTACSL